MLRQQLRKNESAQTYDENGSKLYQFHLNQTDTHDCNPERHERERQVSQLICWWLGDIIEKLRFHRHLSHKRLMQNQSKDDEIEQRSDVVE